MTNKKGLSLAAIFGAVSAAGTAIYMEWNGYAPLTGKDGKNKLADMDPNCRDMTEGEIKMAKSVFGDQIDYNKVKIFSRPFFGLPFSQGRSHAPNGNIYFCGKDAKIPDFSAPTANQKLFIHEMTHVWQFQKGMDLRKIGAKQLKFSFNKGVQYDIEYKYALGDDFKNYNFEQQAEIVSDCFSESRNLHHLKAGDNPLDIRVRRLRLRDYQKTLDGILPIADTLATKAAPAPDTTPPSVSSSDTQGDLFKGAAKQEPKGPGQAPKP